MIFDWLHIKRPTIYTSPIHGKITVGTDKNKGLFSGGVTQSGREIATMWNKVIKDYYLKEHKPKTILILGIGGGSVIQSIRTYNKTVNITGVELDPVMIQVAKEQFGIEENKNQRFIISNAIDFIFHQNLQKQYDLIIVDLYIGPLNPPKSRTKTFMNQLKTFLKPKGTVLYNAHYQKKNSQEYKNFRKITDMLFSQVSEVFSYPLNRVLFMKNDPITKNQAL